MIKGKCIGISVGTICLVFAGCSVSKNISRSIHDNSLEERIRFLEKEVVFLNQKLEQVKEENKTLITNSGIKRKVIINGQEIHLGGEEGEPILKGKSFLGLYSSHVHSPSSLVGEPTSPPIPQGEGSTLSGVVKTQ